MKTYGANMKTYDDMKDVVFRIVSKDEGIVGMKLKQKWFSETQTVDEHTIELLKIRRDKRSKRDVIEYKFPEIESDDDEDDDDEYDSIYDMFFEEFIADVILKDIFAF